MNPEFWTSCSLHVSQNMTFSLDFFFPTTEKTIFGSWTAQTWPLGHSLPNLSGLEEWIESMEAWTAGLVLLPGIYPHNLWNLSSTGLWKGYVDKARSSSDLVWLWANNVRLEPKSFLTLAGFQGAAFQWATLSPPPWLAMLVTPNM